VISDKLFLSILIPCYRGSDVVHFAIDSALRQVGDDIEILVSDDGNESLNALLDRYTDPRLKIFKHQNRLGMQGNFNFLISQAKGDWLTILGQDDAVLPFATDVLRKYAISYPSVEIVTTKRAYMFWPGSKSSFFRYLVPITARKPKMVESHKFLDNSLRGFVEYSEGPQLYTGSFIKHSLVEEITEINGGTFYTYPIPDVSSAVNLLINSKFFLKSQLPLFLVGTSELSTGSHIEKSLQDGNADLINQLLSESFLGGLSLETSPGMGMFTDKSFYLYEAWTGLSGFQRHDKYFSWALASLRLTATKRCKEKSKMKKTIADMASSHDSSLLFIYIKCAILFVIRRCIYSIRGISGIILIARSRLFFESRFTKHPFEPLTALDIINDLYVKLNNRL